MDIKEFLMGSWDALTTAFTYSAYVRSRLTAMIVACLVIAGALAEEEGILAVLLTVTMCSLMGFWLAYSWPGSEHEEGR